MKKKSEIITLFIIVIVAISTLLCKNFLSKQEKKVNKRDRQINSARKIADGFFNGQNILKDVSKFTKCQDSVNCVSFTNYSDNWLRITNPNYAINIEDSLIIKFRFKNINGNAGVSLVGRFPRVTVEVADWWIGKDSLNIISSYGYLIIEADAGISKDPIFIMSDKIPLDKEGFFEFYLIADKFGQNITIVDNKRKIIKIIDIKELYFEYFPEGLFLDGKIYLGITIAPSASLIIDEFYGFPFLDTDKVPSQL